METPRTRSYLLGVAADNVTRNWRERHMRELIYSSFGSRRCDLVTTSTTLTDDHEVVLVNASGGAVTITIPDLTTTPYKSYLIRKIDTSANPVTITPAAGTIDGYNKIFLLGPGHTAELVNPGSSTAWYNVTPHQPLVFRQVSVTNVTELNYTTILGAGQGSYAFPADYFRVGDVLHLFAQGYYSAQNSSFLSFEWKLGSTTFVYGYNDPPVSEDLQNYTLDFYATCLTTGVSGSFQQSGRMTLKSVAVNNLVASGGISGFNTTIAQTMDMRVRHNVAGTNEFKTQTLFVEVLR